MSQKELLRHRLANDYACRDGDQLTVTGGVGEGRGSSLLATALCQREAEELHLIVGSVKECRDEMVVRIAREWAAIVEIDGEGVCHAYRVTLELYLMSRLRPSCRRFR